MSPKPRNQKKTLLVWIAALSAVVLLAAGIMWWTGVFSSLFSSGEDEQITSQDDEDNEDEEAAVDDEAGKSSDSNKAAGDLSGVLGAIKKDLGANRENGEDNQTGETTAPSGSFVADYNVTATLTVWSSNSSIESIINNYAKQTMPNINFETTILTYDEYQQRLMTTIASGSETPDIFTMEPPSVKRYIDSGYFMDLNDMKTTAKNIGLMRYTLDYATDKNGTIRAYPLNVAPGAMFYRRSLAKQYLGTDNPDEIQTMVQDPSRLPDLAQKLYHASNGKCKLCASDEMKVPSKSLRANPWVANNELKVDDTLVNFLDIQKTLKDKGYLADFNQWDANWMNSFSNTAKDANDNSTEVFSYFLPGWGLQYIIKSNSKSPDGSSDTTGDWAMIQGPFQYFYGGTWIGVNAASKNADATKTVVQYLTMDESYLEAWAKENNDNTASLKVNAKVLSDAPDPFLQGQNPFANFSTNAQSINGSVYCSYDEQIDKYWDEQAEAYMSGQLSREEAIKAFKNQVSLLDPNIMIN
ncbi:MAG: extracellular solute-binding protein [Clostridia bacterium]|nr:extracellular solute-binding protein [Clostridia bacterium]